MKPEMGPAAPLTFLPGAPTPQGITAHWLAGEADVPIRWAYAPPLWDIPAKGVVLLLSGRADFIEKHFETICDLQGFGYGVLTLDWRGQGRSGRLLDDPMKGHIDSYEAALKDLRRVLTASVSVCGRPLWVLAHSMGGALAVRALQTGMLDVKAAVLTSPMLGINTGAISSQAAQAIVSVMMRMRLGTAYVPGRATDPLVEVFAKTTLTHDEARFQRSQAYMRAEPALQLGGVTVGWLSQSYRLLKHIWAPRALEAISAPILVQSARPDALVRADMAEAACTRIPHAKFVAFDGARHELLHETDDVRARFWQNVQDFLTPHIR